MIEAIAQPGDLPRFYFCGKVSVPKRKARGCRASLVSLEYRKPASNEFEKVPGWSTTLELPWALVAGDRFGPVEVTEYGPRNFDLLYIDQLKGSMHWYRDGNVGILVPNTLLGAISEDSPFGTYKFGIQITSENAETCKADLYLDWAPEFDDVKVYVIPENIIARPGLPGGESRPPVVSIEFEPGNPKYHVQPPNTPMCRVGIRSHSPFPIRVARVEIAGIYPEPSDFSPHAGIPLTVQNAYPSRPNYTELNYDGEALYNIFTYGVDTQGSWIELMHDVQEVPKRINFGEGRKYFLKVRAVTERPGCWVMNQKKVTTLVIESDSASPVKRMYLNQQGA